MEALGNFNKWFPQQSRGEELAAPGPGGQGQAEEGLTSLPSCILSAEERAWSWRGLSVQPSLPLSRRTSQRPTSGRSYSPRRVMLGPVLEQLGKTLDPGQWRDWGGEHSALFLRCRRAECDLLEWPCLSSCSRHPC